MMNKQFLDEYTKDSAVNEKCIHELVQRENWQYETKKHYKWWHA